MGVVFKKEKFKNIISTLAQAQSGALTEIDTAAATAYVSGFTSAASGTTLSYDSDGYTQTAIQTTAVTAAASETQFTAQFPDGFPIRAKPSADAAKEIIHLTAAQVIVLASDWIARYKTVKAQVWALQEEVNAATTMAAVQAIKIQIV